MSDTEKRDAVLERFAHDAGVHRVWGVAGMADRIVELEAAIERVRALHTIEHPKRARWCRRCKEAVYPCSTLRALEGTP